MPSASALFCEPSSRQAFRVLAEMTQRANGAKSIEDVYEAAIDGLLAATAAQRASVLLFDDAGVMRFVASRGLSTGYRKAVEGHTPWKPDAKDPVPIIIADARQEPTLSELIETFDAEGLRAFAFIPLYTRGRMLGKFMLYSGIPGAFTPADIDIALVAAAAISAAVDQRRSAEHLQLSESRLRAMFEQAAVGIGEVSPDGRFLTANPELCDFYGYSLDELRGRTWKEVTHPQDVAHTSSLLERTLAGEIGSYSVDKRYIRKDGRIVWGHAVTSIIRDSSGKPDRLVGVVKDITHRVQANEALRQSEARFRGIFEQAAIGIAEFSLDGQFLDANERLCSMLGRSVEELQAMRWQDIVHPDDLESCLRLEARLVSGEIPSYMVEKRLLHRDKSYVWSNVSGRLFRDLSGAPVRLIAAIADITERRRLLERLSDSQRMESLGLLAGGIAHDFNNLLTAISGFTSLLVKDVGKLDPRYRFASGILRASESAASLTSQLLTFARRQIASPSSVDLNAVLHQTVTLLQRVIPTSIALDIKPGKDLWPILSDPVQCEQVLLNLTANARDAMPSGGTLGISTMNRTLTSACGELAAGSYVVLEITDTGVGIDPKSLPHIFEPFYTRKLPDQSGTGLGLASVYGIVTQWGGTIRVKSTLAQGTTFTIYWPRSTSTIAATSECEVKPAAPRHVGRGTVLVAEDQDLVREVVCSSLRDADFTVVEASNGQEALNILKSQGREIKLLITDMVMPKLGGGELLRQASEFARDVKFLVITGHPGHEPAITANVRMLAKPFTPAELTAAAIELVGA